MDFLRYRTIIFRFVFIGIVIYFGAKWYLNRIHADDYSSYAEINVLSKTGESLGILSDGKSVVLDGMTIPLTDTVQHRKLKMGTHWVKGRDFGQKFDFTIGRGEHVLLNVFRDTIIMEVVAPGADVVIDTITVSGKRYAGPYKIIGGRIYVKEFDLGLNQYELPANLTEYEQKMVADRSLRKISSIEEFISHKEALK